MNQRPTGPMDPRKARQLLIRVTVAPIVIGLMIAGLYVWLFAAAFSQPQPHALPVGVVGPEPAVAAITAGLDKNAPGAFSVTTYESADAARAAIDDRTIAGAYIAGPGAPQILVASGNSAASAGAISGAFGAIAKATGAVPTVTDIHPLTSTDPQGVVPFFLILGVSQTGLLYQMITGFMPFRPSRRVRLAAMTVFAIVAGLTAACAYGLVLGFSSSFWLLALTCIGVAWAVAAPTAALQSMFGLPGVGLAALFFMMLGGSSSGGMTGAPFAPDGFRQLAAIMPNGVGLFSVRSALYFDGAAMLVPLLILAAWIVGGLVVMGAVESRQPRVAAHSAVLQPA